MRVLFRIIEAQIKCPIQGSEISVVIVYTVYNIPAYFLALYDTNHILVYQKLHIVIFTFHLAHMIWPLSYESL